MNRRNFIQNSSLAFGGLMMPSNSLVSNFLFDDPFKIKLVRNNVSVFTEKGGTIGFLQTKNHFAVVDSQFQEQATHLITELKKLSENSIEFLINTHHHGDHTSGNIAFKGLVEHVVAHENSLINQTNTAKTNKTEDKQLYSDVTFSDKWKVKIDSEAIRAHYFGAGHTNGDSLIHFEHSNVLHMGDLMFNRRYPYIDKSAGANISNWISVLDKTISTFDKDTIFIFGHAFEPEKITGNKEDIKVFKDYLEKLLTHVGSDIKAGKSKEEILKLTAINGVSEMKGDGILRSLTAAYEELSTKP